MDGYRRTKRAAISTLCIQKGQGHCSSAMRPSILLDETKRLIREAVEIHLSSMREDGDPIPDAA
jgi:hypothetical protein